MERLSWTVSPNGSSLPEKPLQTVDTASVAATQMHAFY
jgi:hypothetical protein